ncbi:MAG: lysophospholipid acyltransferase family protein [Planctomycetota bacterium]
MSKARSPWADFAVYALVRCMVGVIQALPLRSAMAMGESLGRLAYRLDKRHRQVACENLAHAFPETMADAVPGGGARREAMARATFIHFARMVVEMVWLPRVCRLTVYRGHIDLGDRPGDLVSLLLSGRPVILATGHFGNWEMAGYLLGLLGFRSYAIARVLDNPRLEEFLKKFRQRTGQTILAKKGDFDRITEVLGSRGILATLADQDAGPRGQFVNFFNRPASTHKALALMALEYDAPVVVCGAARVGGPLRYKLEIEEILEPSAFKHQPGAVASLTQAYTTALERLVRRYPEQYFWLHRRWKHEPPKRSKTKALAPDTGMASAGTV